jgi:hypothetical protein
MAADGMASGPSEAELEQMLAQMREAPAEQVLVEVINALLQAAQVKLGRPDARVLIDAVAALAQSAEGRADEALLGQVAQAVTQLRLAQVEAEGGDGGDTDRTGAAGAPMSGPQTARRSRWRRGGRRSGPAPSRLWVPGS